jgi:hypothetical protein
MPNQSVAAPSSGITMVAFSGTVTLEPGWFQNTSSVGVPENSSHTAFLVPSFDSAFLGWNGFGTYSGAIFDIAVPQGAPLGLYSLNIDGSPVLLTLAATFVGGKFVNGGPPAAFASQAFSVLVTNGNTVPESGSSMLLLGASVAGLCCLRRFLFA